MSELELLLDDLAESGVRVTWCRHIARALWLPQQGILLVSPSASTEQMRRLPVVRNALGGRI